jgi:hypothetical protein
MKKILILLSIAVAIMFAGCAVPKTECVSSEDCLGRPHDPCEGSWACKSSVCVWYCNTQPPVTCPYCPSLSVTTTTAAPTTTLADITVPTELADQIKKDIGSQKAMVRPILNRAAIGDKVIFGVGIYNLYREQRNYEVRTAFYRAYDMTYSRISSENPTIDQWIIEKSRMVTIPAESSAVVPIGFIIGYMIDDKQDTVPGTYTFSVKIFESSVSSQKEYTTTQADILVS